MRISLVLITALAALASTPAAKAAVIYSGLQNIAIPTSFEGIYINIDNAATGGASFTGWDINPFFGGAGFANSSSFQPARTGTGNIDPYIRLDSGDLIDASLLYSSGNGGSGDPVGHLGAGPDQFGVGQEGFVAFRFMTDSSAGPYYGWMRVTLTNGVSGGIISDWAFDDSGAAITAGAGAVPEPGRVGLLGLGLLGWITRRRRSGAVTAV